MSKTFRVLLPTKPHLRKFLHHHHGYPLQLDHRNHFGNILLALLENQNSCGMNLAKKRNRQKRFTATVECIAAARRLERKGLSDDQIININRWLEAEFEQALYNYVQKHTGPKGRYPGYKQALAGFMQEYHLCRDVDITVDSLTKMEYRYRQQLTGTRQQCSFWEAEMK